MDAALIRERSLVNGIFFFCFFGSRIRSIPYPPPADAPLWCSYKCTYSTYIYWPKTVNKGSILARMILLALVATDQEADPPNRKKDHPLNVHRLYIWTYCGYIMIMPYLSLIAPKQSTKGENLHVWGRWCCSVVADPKTNHNHKPIRKKSTTTPKTQSWIGPP